MRTRLATIAVVGILLGVVLGGVAEACTCTDRDGCGSALSCSGKSAGDACAPPNGATCKAIKGFSGPLTCCCGCRRGNANAADCSGYPEVFAAVVDLRTEGAACGRKAKGATRSTAKGVLADLKQGEKSCKKGQRGKGKAKGKRTAAKKKLQKLDQKIEKFANDEQVTPECKAKLQEYARDIIVDVDNADRGTEDPPPTTTTTTAGTTTTTIQNPPGVSCNAAFTPFDATEVLYGFSCSDSGSPSPFDGFAIFVPGGRQIILQIDPFGFSCSTQNDPPGTNNSRFCQGAVQYGASYGGNLRMNPGPATGMGGFLRLYTAGNVVANYNITGP
jgi:hypothetical protein